MLQLLDNSKIKDFVNFFQQQYTQDVSMVTVIGTLCDPVTKHLLKVFVNHSEPTECTFLVIKMPSWKEVWTSYYKQPSNTNENEFSCFQFWCRDTKRLTLHDITKALTVYYPRSPILKTEKRLYELLLAEMKERPKFSRDAFLNVLESEIDFRTNQCGQSHGDCYVFRTMKREEFEEKMLECYSPARCRSFEYAIDVGANYGAFCKETDELAGWVFLGMSGSIDSLQVFPSHRSKGLAKTLVYKMVEYSCQHGIVPHGYAEDPKRSYLQSIGFEQYSKIVFLTYAIF